MNENEKNMQEITPTDNPVETAGTAPENKTQDPLEKDPIIEKADSKADVQSFTQEQVNEIVTERLKRQSNKFYSRYGVKAKEELDELVGKSQAYDVMKERYENLIANNKSMTEKIAFLENNIDPERYEDVRTYFKGKEMDFTGDNLIEALKTHNEWIKKPSVAPTTTLMGSDRNVLDKVETEDDKMKRVFGI